MTEKRFKHMRNQLGMQFICYDDKEELLGTFADAQGVQNIVEVLNQLSEENEQLKERNNRQAKQLDRIYQLIEEKDWRTLNDILDDFKRCEEQLQKEWKCYE